MSVFGGSEPFPIQRPINILELRGSLTPRQALVARLFAFAVFVTIWEVGAIAADSILIPTFTETMVALYQTMFVTGEIWLSLWISNMPFLVGFVISVAFSVPLGLAMARWKAVDAAISPIAALALAMPVGPLTQ